MVTLSAVLLVVAGFIFLKNTSALSSDFVPALPKDTDSLVRQAAASIHAAWREDGIHHQTIKLPLSEAMYKQKEESFVADRAIGWQGGPQETYRYLSPLVQDIMREVSVLVEKSQAGSTSQSGLTSKLQVEDLLDFDGSALCMAQSPLGPLFDSIALLQPNTDAYYSQKIAQVENDFSDSPGKKKRLFLLVNPGWRDSSSFGFFGRRQSSVLERYPVTYAMDQFIAKGKKLSVLKAWPHDWSLYWTPLPQPGTSEEPEPQLLGTFPDRPEYAVMEKLLLKALKN